MSFVKCLEQNGLSPDDVTRVSELIDSGLDELSAVSQVAAEIETDLQDIADRVSDAAPSEKTGLAFRDFFAAVTAGETGVASVATEHRPVISSVMYELGDPMSDISGYRAEYLSHKGKFDDHIALSIPGYRDFQFAVGNAILQTFPDGGEMLDVGASEGTQAKTITSLSEGAIRTTSLDPNLAMRDTFRDRSSVEGAEFSLTALGYQPNHVGLAWTEDDGTDIYYYDEGGKQFDIVQESMVFQFINDERDAQVARLAGLVKDDGVVIIQEKVFTDRFKENEQFKNQQFKKLSFTGADLDSKATQVLEGMHANMVSQQQLEDTLGGHFEHVVQLWDSGNFKGYAASNSEDVINRFSTAVGDTSSPFDTRDIGYPSLSFNSNGKLRTDRHGMIPLTHWGKKGGLESIDPGQFGTAAAGAESKRVGPDFRNRTYYGLPGYHVESTVNARSSSRYFTKLPREALYDYTKDPDGLFQTIKSEFPGYPDGALIGKYENAIVDAGYQGYWVDAAQGPVAAVFHPLPVEEMSKRSAHVARGGRGIAGYDAEGHALEEIPLTLYQSRQDEFRIGAERQERKTDTGRISAAQKKLITKEAKRIGQPISVVEGEVRRIMGRYPVSDGWQQMEVSKIVKKPKPGPGEIPFTVEFKPIPYGFSKASPKSLSKKLVGVYRSLEERVTAGDPSANVIMRQAGWYRNMRARLREEFGGMGDVFADLLGATSPNTSVDVNWMFAIRALREASKGTYDHMIIDIVKWAEQVDYKQEQLASYVRGQKDQGRTLKSIKEDAEYHRLSKSIPYEGEVPRQPNGKLYGMNSSNVLGALADMWRIVTPGTAPKARNFSGNLIGYTYQATIDVWAARLLQDLSGKRRIPNPVERAVQGLHKVGSTKEVPKIGGAYGVGVETFKLAADELGINPDDLQAIVWFYQKEVWTLNNWTNKAGEGGSFEEEADKAPMERLIGLLSTQTSEEYQGVDYIPSDEDMSKVARKLADTALSSKQVVAVKSMSTVGQYGSDRERSFDLEITARSGYDATPVWKEIVRTGRDAKQDAVGLSRVVTDDIDPLKHRPGVEIYFTDAQDIADMDDIISNLRQKGLEAFTFSVDARRLPEAVAGEMPPVVGLRLQYVPEFDDRAGHLKDFTDEELTTHMEQEEDKLLNILDGLTDMDNVSYAQLLYYETRISFTEDYNHELYRGTEGGTRAEDRAAWTGRTVREGIGAANRHTEATRVEERGAAVPDERQAGLILEQSPAFEKWFKDSKVVDENGDPLVVYHGTNEQFDTFEQRKGVVRILFSEIEVDRKGFFFTPDRAIAESFGDTVIPVYLSIQNMADLSNLGTEAERRLIEEKGINEAFLTGHVETWEMFDDEDGDIIVQSLKELGYDGVLIDEPAVEGEHEAGVAYVVFEPTQIKSASDNRGTYDPNDPNILKQGPRGSIEILPDEHIIRLGKSSDLSTFLHESGHLFLQMEKQFAADYGMTEEQYHMLEWLGVGSFEEIGVDQHEQFARGFEAYLREGKAPSLALRDAFAAFRRWLTRIYQTVRDLNVELNDDIRQVFDRLLATEAQIEEAAANPAYDQFFRSKEQAGMTDDEWVAYQKRVNRAKGTAQQTLDEKVLKELTNRRTTEWKDMKAPIVDEEIDRLSKTPVYQLLSDASEWPMDYDAAKEILGFTKQPGKLIGKLKKGGVDPNEYAEAHGFPTAAKMFKEVLAAPSLKQAADEAAEQRMVETHGDILNDGSIEDEVREVMHNEEQAELLIYELRALRRKSGRMDDINRDYLKSEAKALIQTMTFKEIQPGKYYRAEIRSAQNAVKADTNQAKLDAKTQQLVNHYLYKEATEVKQRMEKHRSYIRKIQTRKYSNKVVHPEYSQNMRTLANLYDLRTNPERVADVGTLVTWYETQIADKNQYVQLNMLDLTLIAALEAKRNGQMDSFIVPTFDDLTADSMQGLYDMLRHLRYVGGAVSDEAKLKWKVKIEGLVASILDNGRTDFPVQPGSARTGKSLRRNFSHFMNRIPALRNMIRKLDNEWGKTGTGTAYDTIYSLVEEGNNRKIEYHKKMFDVFKDELKNLHTLKLSKHDAKVYELESGFSWSATSEERFMLGLYWGTETSRDAIRDGFGMTDEDVATVLSDLTTDQVEMLNTVWKVNEALWPDLSSAAVQMDGVAPPKLDPIPFNVNGIQLTGGHMRLMYDSVHIEMKNEQDEAGHRASVMPTKAGSLHARVGSGGNPPLLDTNNIVRAINDNVHYIAFADVGNQLRSIVNATDIRNAIVKKHGAGFYTALVETLEGITSQRVERDSVAFLAGMMRLLRRAATFKHLAYSIRNTVQQFSAIPVAMEEVGTAAWLNQAAAYWNPQTSADFTEFVNSRSKFMSDRASVVNREAAEYLRQITIDTKAGHLWKQFEAYGFTPQTIVDRTIAYPTWMARYEQSMAENGDQTLAISQADSAVAESVGSGSNLHLGGLFQTNQTEFVRTFTVFGSWFNNYFQRVYRSTQGGEQYFNAEVAKAVLVTPIITGTIAAALIMDGVDDDDEWWQWFLKNYTSFMAGTLPLTRDIASSFSGFSPKTVYSGGAESPAKLYNEVTALIEGKQSVERGVSDITKLATTWAPVPGIGNVTRVLDYTDSYNKGREGDWNWYQAFVEGPDKQR